VYRVAQEALMNVVRHAHSDQAWLILRRVEGAVEREVVDAGDGFDATAVAEGAAIRGMRDRALLVGAELEVRSRPRSGTTVRLRCPASTVSY
jgi:two-component system, NarL family, sensor histidine kinase UhpB